MFGYELTTQFTNLPVCPLFTCCEFTLLNPLQVSPLGFGSTADEWLPRFSPRLARLNWFSGGARGSLQPVPPSLESEQERDLPVTDVADPQVRLRSSQESFE
jgi:hypothetical protein